VLNPIQIKCTWLCW